MTLEIDRLRVLVIAGDPLARGGLVALLSGLEEFDVVGQAAASDGVSDDIEVYQPNVIVWDTGWEPEEAIEYMADVAEMGIPIVALLPDDAHAPDALTGGARALLSRSVEPGTLRAALLAVAQGLAAFDQELVASLVSARTPGPDSTLPVELTAREGEVLRLLGEGMSNKAIAFRLGISEHTVKFHVNSIMTKLGVQSRTEAVVLATRMGLIPL